MQVQGGLKMIVHFESFITNTQETLEKQQKISKNTRTIAIYVIFKHPKI